MDVLVCLSVCLCDLCCVRSSAMVDEVTACLPACLPCSSVCLSVCLSVVHLFVFCVTALLAVAACVRVWWLCSCLAVCCWAASLMAGNDDCVFVL